MSTIVANVIVTVLLTRASMVNYPGGQILALFNARYDGQPHGAFSSYYMRINLLLTYSVFTVHVHISNLAAQTGASLFLHTHASPHLQASYPPSDLLDWTYNKTESLSTHALLAENTITHLIAEEPCSELLEGWNHVESVSGFDGWKIDKGLVKERAWGRVGEVLTMSRREMLCIMERKTLVS